MRGTYSTLDTIAVVLVVIGALNWGLIGFFNYNLVDAMFGAGSGLTRIIYILVGLAGLLELWTWAMRLSRGERMHTARMTR